MAHLFHIDIGISVYPKKGDIPRIDYDSMQCVPMSYTLIWPYEEPSWHINMQYNGKRKTAIRCNISMREYVCFRIAIKGTPLCGNFNPVLSSGKLTQQLIVDYYFHIEGDRLKYIRS
jgi:hypothetical protein